MKEGWRYRYIDELIEHLRTGLNPRVHFKLNTEDAIGYYITVRELDGFRFICDDATDMINEAALKRINQRSNLKIGDVLFSGTGTLGRTALVTEEPKWWNIKEGVYALTPKSSILDSKFLIYAFMSDVIMRKIYAKASGTTIRSIPMKELRKIEIPLPPLSEQQSIVSYLDSSFAKIDAMKVNAEKALEEAKALFQATLKEMLEPKEGWEEKTLKDISIIYGNYGLSVPSTTYNGIRYLRITDITEWGDLNEEKVSAKIEDGTEQAVLEEGDILFARTGATVGKTLIYKEEFGDCLFAGYLIRYRLNKTFVVPKFVFYITHSDAYYKWVLENQKAAAQPNISAKLYNEYLLSFPSLSEQQSIVTTLDTLKSKVDSLQANYDKISQECDALKQAILRQVFE